MNRREFGKSIIAASAALALPVVASAKPAYDHTWSGPHLAEFDNNDAIICTAQRAMGTLWYGNQKPQIIMSPPRVVGRIWQCIIPAQRVKENAPWFYSGHSFPGKALRFNGALWLANDALTDEIVFVNNTYVRDEWNDVWKKFNGWYRASKRILGDPINDYYFKAMQES